MNSSCVTEKKVRSPQEKTKVGRRAAHYTQQCCKYTRAVFQCSLGIGTEHLRYHRVFEPTFMDDARLRIFRG